MTRAAHGRLVDSSKPADSLGPIAAVALRSAIQIGLALLLILVLLPAAVGAIGAAAP